MTASNYARALALVLVSEGGFVNNPKDPGGATNLGITIATLRAYRGRAVSVDDVRRLTKEEAAAIYRRNYWDAIKGDQLPAGVDYAVFDFAVNSGNSRAATYLQRCLNVVADGEIGPVTLQAAHAARPGQLVSALCDRRLDFLHGLNTWPTFGAGWSARVARVRKDALAMAANPVPVDPSPDTRKPGLVAGDSIAVGTGGELGGFETNAKVGIPSAEIIARILPGYRYYIISAGSNDGDQKKLEANLRTIRARAMLSKPDLIVWIGPAVKESAATVARFVVETGDPVVNFISGADHVHPRSYGALAGDVMAVIRKREAQPATHDQPVIPDGPPPVVKPPTLPPRQPDDPGSPSKAATSGLFAALLNLILSLFRKGT